MRLAVGALLFHLGVDLLLHLGAGRLAIDENQLPVVIALQHDVLVDVVVRLAEWFAVLIGWKHVFVLAPGELPALGVLGLLRLDRSSKKTFRRWHGVLSKRGPEESAQKKRNALRRHAPLYAAPAAAVTARVSAAAMLCSSYDFLDFGIFVLTLCELDYFGGWGVLPYCRYTSEFRPIRFRAGWRALIRRTAELPHFHASSRKYPHPPLCYNCSADRKHIGEVRCQTIYSASASSTVTATCLPGFPPPAKAAGRTTRPWSMPSRPRPVSSRSKPSPPASPSPSPASGAMTV